MDIKRFEEELFEIKRQKGNFEARKEAARRGCKEEWINAKFPERVSAYSDAYLLEYVKCI